ncbi:MAG: MauE/DoxX family redox-associated membrane protein [Actinomycetota bacterium]
MSPSVVLSWLLAAAFGWAAASKVANLAGWRAGLEPYGLPRSFAGVTLVGVPLAEAGVVVLTVLGRHRAAAALALALLASFSLALLRARSRIGARLPCGCFGRSKTRPFSVLVARNALLSVLAAATLLLAGAHEVEIGPPTGSALLPALLGATGLAVGTWMVVRAGSALRTRSR